MVIRLLAAAVGLLFVLSAMPAGATVAEDCLAVLSTSPRIDRVAGDDRYETAACASWLAYPDATGGSVVLARGDIAGGLADALAGTVLARSLDGPVLLTDPEVLPTPTRAELVRLAPSRVVVLGGSDAVDEAVLTDVEAALPTATVERIGGQDRYLTAAAVSAEAGGQARRRSS